jgi:hypothetical protein
MAKTYENYPIWIVAVVLVLFLAIYLAGAYIMFRLHLIAGILFALYVILMEYFTYKEACPNCYYYGKRCFSGRGLAAQFVFKKGDPKKFCEKAIEFKDFLPQIIMLAVPIIVGIALLISRGFHLLTLIAVLYPVFNWFFVNPILYGKLACPHCKQGKKCCPALEFFSKKR